jgi:hypothetical protein
MEQAMLKPCQYRNVTEEGRLECAKIVRGDREITPEICQACPFTAINCEHLRFSLEKDRGGSVLVHYANGRTEVLDGEPDGVRFHRAACSLLAIPVSGPAMCARCALRQPAVVPDRQIAEQELATAVAENGNVRRLADRSDLLVAS